MHDRDIPPEYDQPAAPRLAYSAEAEQAVIGSMLLDNSSLDTLGELQAADFLEARLRMVFGVIVKQIAAGQACDPLTVYDALAHEGEGTELLIYLNACMASVVTTRNAGRYARIVLDRSTDRKLAKLAADLGQTAADPSKTPAQKIEEAQAALTRLIVGDQADAGLNTTEDTLLAHLDLIERRSEGKDDYTPTGLRDFDEKLDGGTRPGQVLVIGARPSMGKTTLAMTIARHQAAIEPDRKKGQVPCWVLFLSQEMPIAQLNDANIAALGHVSLTNVRRPRLEDHDTWTRIVEGVERGRSLRMFLDDTGSLRLTQVRTKTLAAMRSAKARGGRLATVFVDFLQLMTGDGDNKNTQLDLISNGLKSLALALGVTFIVLSQCNRECDKKPDGADSMSDLRDSGAIEAAADIVALVHREYVRTEDPNLLHYASIRIPKNRFGSVGRFNAFFHGAHQYFGDYSGAAPMAGSGKSRRTFQTGGMD